MAAMNFIYFVLIAVFFGQSTGQLNNCNYLLTNATGNASSPNFPNDYDNNLYCQYFIVVEKNEPINLTFTSFNTEALLDIVKVYDGPDISYRLLLEESGKNLPPPVKSTNGVLLLIFTSDLTNTFPGFQASYSAPTISSTASNQLLTAATGIFTSPNYPANYDDNLQCRWYIVAKIGEKIQLTFRSLDIENTYDIIRVYDGLTTWSTILLTITGKEPPAPIVSTSGALLVVFTSDASGTDTGFEAFYEVVNRQAMDIF